MRNRQLDILVYLLKHKKSTYRELAKRFEVCTKTIERDIDRLSSFGVPVYCQQGMDGGVFIDEKYKFDTSFFSLEEIYYIVTAIHISKIFINNSKGKEILQKLSLIAPNITAVFEDNVIQNFNIDTYDKPIDFDKGIFIDINKCLDLRLLANINRRKRK